MNAAELFVKCYFGHSPKGLLLLQRRGRERDRDTGMGEVLLRSLLRLPVQWSQ